MGHYTIQSVLNNATERPGVRLTGAVATDLGIIDGCGT
jgi:hypothetical protein